MTLNKHYVLIMNTREREFLRLLLMDNLEVLTDEDDRETVRTLLNRTDQDPWLMTNTEVDYSADDLYAGP